MNLRHDFKSLLVCPHCNDIKTKLQTHTYRQLPASLRYSVWHCRMLAWRVTGHGQKLGNEVTESKLAIQNHKRWFPEVAWSFVSITSRHSACYHCVDYVNTKKNSPCNSHTSGLWGNRQWHFWHSEIKYKESVGSRLWYLGHSDQYTLVRG